MIRMKATGTCSHSMDMECLHLQPVRSMKGNIEIVSGKGMEFSRGQMEENTTGPGNKINSMEIMEFKRGQMDANTKGLLKMKKCMGLVSTTTKMVRSLNESIIKEFIFAQ